MARSIHGALSIPGATEPLDRVHYRLYYPAVFGNSETERQTGQLPPDEQLAPWPVVIICNGVNVPADGYRWFAQRLVQAGYAVVTYSCIEELMPGALGLSPGLDLDALTSAEYGSRPSSTVISPLLGAIHDHNSSGPLEGMLNTDHLILGGHSAGGTVALLNADPLWFPSVRRVFAFAGHTMPAERLGHPPGTVLPIAGEMPALLLGGSDDGVIAASTVRYGDGDSETHDPITATFDTATTAGSALAIVDEAGHLTFCDPIDETTARGFLESTPDPALASAQRELIGDLVVAFCSGDAEKLHKIGHHKMLKTFRMR